jgi:hypothetical protein
MQSRAEEGEKIPFGVRLKKELRKMASNIIATGNVVKKLVPVK